MRVSNKINFFNASLKLCIPWSVIFWHVIKFIWRFLKQTRFSSPRLNPRIPTSSILIQLSYNQKSPQNSFIYKSKFRLRSCNEGKALKSITRFFNPRPVSSLQLSQFRSKPHPNWTTHSRKLRFKACNKILLFNPFPIFNSPLSLIFSHLSQRSKSWLGIFYSLKSRPMLVRESSSLISLLIYWRPVSVIPSHLDNKMLGNVVILYFWQEIFYARLLFAGLRANSSSFKILSRISAVPLYSDVFAWAWSFIFLKYKLTVEELRSNLDL